MKRVKCWCFTIGCFILFLALIVGCGTGSRNYNSSEVVMSGYYSIEDFESISIGESTVKDVYNIAPAKTIQVTSYGGFVEYPSRTGGIIRIKFYGKEMIVGSIEENNTNNQP